MPIEEAQLENFIVDSGLVSKKDMESYRSTALKRRESVEDILLRKGVIAEDELRRIKAYILGIPFIDLKNHRFDLETLSVIPEPIARNHNIIAFKKTDDALEVAMLDVEDLPAIDFIKKKARLRVLTRLTDNESMKQALLSYQKILKAEFGDIIQKESVSIKQTGKNKANKPVSEQELRKLSEDAPIVRIVDALLSHAIVQNASDIHIEPEADRVLVRYRIDGLLRDAMVLPKSAASGTTARIKALSNLKLDESNLPQDGRFKIESAYEKTSFRVSTLPTYYGEKIVLRLLRESMAGFTLESLGFYGQGLEDVHKSLKLDKGLILVSGPTGGGKTTTLYTMLDILNTPDVNISTIEDPIEYQMARINQTQINPEIGLTFANGLRALVRQDPDVIMVGEIRDVDTASVAFNAALTGHLVLSTLHASSAANAISRLIELKVEPFLLASTLNVVVSRLLVKKLSENKIKHFLTKEELEFLSSKISMDRTLKLLKDEKIVGQKDTWEKVAFWRTAPSGNKQEAGSNGRIGIHEVLKLTPTIKELIVRGASAAELEAQAKKEGMVTMLEDGVLKAAQGIISLEELSAAFSSKL